MKTTCLFVEKLREELKNKIVKLDKEIKEGKISLFTIDDTAGGEGVEVEDDEQVAVYYEEESDEQEQDNEDHIKEDHVI